MTFQVNSVLNHSLLKSTTALNHDSEVVGDNLDGYVDVGVETEGEGGRGELGHSNVHLTS